MYIAQAGREDNARLVRLEHERRFVMRIDGARVRTVDRFAVRGEIGSPYLVGKLASFWMEPDGDPPDVMLGLVRMSYFLADGDLDLEHLTLTYGVR